MSAEAARKEPRCSPRCPPRGLGAPLGPWPELDQTRRRPAGRTDLLDRHSAELSAKCGRSVWTL